MTKNRKSLLLATVAFLLLSLARSQLTSTSVCSRVSPEWFPLSAVQPTQVRYTETWTFADNRDMITGVHYCVEIGSGDTNILRNWILQGTNLETGAITLQDYGRDTSATKTCLPGTSPVTFDLVDQDIKKFRVYFNQEDADGFQFTLLDGTEQNFRANEVNNKIEAFTIPGRILGMNVQFGDNGVPGNLDAPLTLSLNYNGCMCPLSSFIKQFDILPLTITAVTGTVEQTTFIARQKDVIGETWGQNCGGYEVRLEPDHSFLSLNSLSGRYTDQIVLQPVTNDQVGKYEVRVIISNPGYNEPVPGKMDDIEYNLTVQLKPCPIFAIDKASDQTIQYEIGSDGETSNPYSFAQNPACNWPEVTTITWDPPQPSFIRHDEENKVFILDRVENNDSAGSYTISVTNTATYKHDIDNPTETRELPVTTKYIFNVNARCEASNMRTSTVFPDPVLYQLQDPAFTLSFEFQFDNNQVSCVFPITYSLTPDVGVNRPANIILNEEELQIEITFANDPSQIGIYNDLVLSASVNNLEGGGSTAVANTISAEITFSVHIEACPITQFTSLPLSLGTFTRIIGDLSQNFGDYEYSQTKNCGYTVSQELVGDTLPDMITWSEMNQQFTMTRSEDLLQVGIYDVRITGEITFNIGTTTSTDSRSLEIPLQIVIVNPCLTSTLSDFSVRDMTAEINLGNDSQVLTLPSDSVSQTLGDKSGNTFCGARHLEIIDLESHASYLSWDDSNYEFTVQSTNKDDIGSHQVTINAFLVDYPDDVSRLQTFTVSITPCTVSSFAPQSTSDQIYNLFDPAIPKIISATPFSSVPDCARGMTYSFQKLNDVTRAEESLPGFILQSTTQLTQLTLSSNKQSDAGVYTIQMTGSAPSLADQKITFQLTVYAGDCDNEILGPKDALDPFEYIIDKSGSLKIAPEWSSTVEQTSNFKCPATYEFYSKVGDDWVTPMIADQEPTLTFNAANGSVDVLTTDTSLDGSSWFIRLTKTGIYSQASQNESGLSGPVGIIEIQINFLHKCWRATLTAPKFEFTHLSYGLDQLQQFFYTHMKSSEDCGGITHELIYNSGPLLIPTPPDLSTIYTQSIAAGGDRTEVEGMIDDNQWKGTYSLTIKGTNGQVDSSFSAFGNEGLFNSVVSQPLYIKIKNPCENSIVNHDNGFQISNLLQVDEGFTEIAIRQKGPKNSSSDEVGNGYDLCGPLEYSIQFQDFIKATNNNALVLNVKKNTNMADDFSLALNSVAFGREIRRNIILTIRLQDYQSSTPAVIETEIVYRECRPDNFIGRKIADQSVRVGDPELKIAIIFDQTPCSYDQSYEAFLVNERNNQEMSLPDYMTINAGTPRMLHKRRYLQNDDLTFNILETRAGNEGRFQIRIYSQLNNFYKTRVSLDFVINVLPSEPFVIEHPPKWIPQLIDQRVPLGKSIRYSPEFIAEAQDYDYSLHIHLGIVKLFGEYYNNTNELVIDGQKMNRNDIGTFQVIFVGQFSKEGKVYIRRQTALNITIYDPSDTWCGMPVCPQRDTDTDYPDWFEAPYSNLVPETYSDNGTRPTPYIHSLSVTGLLRIGWNQNMTVPEQAIDIAEKKIAVTDWSAFSPEDQKKRLLIGYWELWGLKPAMLLALIDALEVRILRETDDWYDQEIKFTWSISGYSNRFLDLQIDVRNPENIGETGSADVISVIFWGNHYFKNTQGNKVLYGTELRTDVFRIISPEEAANLDILLGITWTAVLIILCLGIVGAQLPTWMFINSLSLIVHTTLLNSVMPPSIFYVFQKYLNMVRFNSPGFNKHIEETYDVHDYTIDEGSFSHYLSTSDYVHLFARNMVIFLIAALAIALVWVLFVILDYLSLVKRNKTLRKYWFLRRLHEPYINNFALRFFYEIFLELCICCFIQLSLVDFDFASPGFQWILSFIIFLAIVIYLGWIISLFYINGPYLVDFYGKKTALESFWWVRPINPDYYAQHQSEIQDAKRKAQINKTILKNRGLTMRRDELLKQKNDISVVQNEVETSRTAQQFYETQRTDSANNFDTGRPLMLTQTVPVKANFSPEAYHQDSKDFTPNRKDQFAPSIMISQDLSLDLQEELRRRNEQPYRKETSSSYLGSKLFLEPKHSSKLSADTSSYEEEIKIPLHKIKPDKTFEYVIRSSERSVPTKVYQNSTFNRKSEPESIKTFKPLTLKRMDTQHMLQEMFPDPQDRAIVQNEINLEKDLHSIGEEEQSSSRQISAQFENSLQSRRSAQEQQQMKAKQLYSIPQVPLDNRKTYSQPMRIGNKAQPVNMNRLAVGTGRETVPKAMDYEQYEGGHDVSRCSIGSRYKDSSPSGNSNTRNGRAFGRQTQYDSQTGQVVSVNITRCMHCKNQTRHYCSKIADCLKWLWDRTCQNPEFVQNMREQAKEKNKITDEEKEDIQYWAREIAASQEILKKPKRYKTLYYGLKMNHPRNVAIVHPLMYTLRRILYALIVVFMFKAPLLGTWILLGTTLLMLMYVLVEMQWDWKVVSIQHIFNEFTMYFVCIHLLMFTNFVSGVTRVFFGYILIGIFVCFIIYNSILLLDWFWWHFRLFFRQKWLKLRQLRLKQEIKSIFKKVQASMDELNKQQDEEFKDWFTPDDLERHWKPQIKQSQSNGLQMVIKGFYTGHHVDNQFSMLNKTENNDQKNISYEIQEIVYEQDEAEEDEISVDIISEKQNVTRSKITSVMTQIEPSPQQTHKHTLTAATKNVSNSISLDESNDDPIEMSYSKSKKDQTFVADKYEITSNTGRNQDKRHALNLSPISNHESQVEFSQIDNSILRKRKKSVITVQNIDSLNNSVQKAADKMNKVVGITNSSEDICSDTEYSFSREDISQIQPQVQDQKRSSNEIRNMLKINLQKQATHRNKITRAATETIESPKGQPVQLTNKLEQPQQSKHVRNGSQFELLNNLELRSKTQAGGKKLNTIRSAEELIYLHKVIEAKRSSAERSQNDSYVTDSTPQISQIDAVNTSNHKVAPLKKQLIDSRQGSKEELEILGMLEHQNRNTQAKIEQESKATDENIDQKDQRDYIGQTINIEQHQNNNGSVISAAQSNSIIQDRVFNLGIQAAEGQTLDNYPYHIEHDAIKVISHNAKDNKSKVNESGTRVSLEGNDIFNQSYAQYKQMEKMRSKSQESYQERTPNRDFSTQANQEVNQIGQRLNLQTTGRMYERKAQPYQNNNEQVLNRDQKHRLGGTVLLQVQEQDSVNYQDNKSPQTERQQMNQLLTARVNRQHANGEKSSPDKITTTSQSNFKRPAGKRLYKTIDRRQTEDIIQRSNMKQLQQETQVRSLTRTKTMVSDFNVQLSKNFNTLSARGNREHLHSAANSIINSAKLNKQFVTPQQKKERLEILTPITSQQSRNHYSPRNNL